MSAFLLGVGFKADMGTCVRKLLLLKMIDACEDDGTRIFPAVSTLARAAQCSSRTVQREIKVFLDCGLIKLVREGGRGRRSTNEYAMDLDALYKIAKVGWDAFVGADEVKGDTVSPLEDAAKGDTDDTLRVTNEPVKGDTRCHPTPPLDPSLYPSTESASAQAGASAPVGAERGDRSDAEIEKLFRKLAKGWPDFAGMPRARALAAFQALTAEEQDEALKHRDDWLALLRKQRKSHTPAPSTYLGEKLWLDVPEEGVDGPQVAEMAQPFGKLWAAERFADLTGPAYGRMPKPTAFIQKLLDAGGETGRREELSRLANYGWPKAKEMDRDAGQRKGCCVSADRGLLAALCVQVKRGGALWQAWRAEHAARGWPRLDDVHPPEWVWLPGCDGPAPDADKAAAQAYVRVALERFEAVKAAVTTEKKEAAE